MVNIISATIIILLFAGASYYIYKEKKKGRHCIGCPMAGNCPRHKGCAGHADKAGINGHRSDME